jgi:hypothetical protein
MLQYYLSELLLQRLITVTAVASQCSQYRSIILASVHLFTSKIVLNSLTLKNNETKIIKS